MAQRRLAEYAAKRDFAKTSEPAPQPGSAAHDPGSGARFVVQRHRARRLHYDFRLEIGGVLVSWAVPKGPTLDPAARHLAVHVEDHPLDYIEFEGVIPAGEYGGGDVIVWDRGTWAPHHTDDPAQAVADGELHVDLNGEKLKGRFILVRSDGRRRAGRSGRPSGGGKDEWLLFHKRDEFAQAGWDPEDHPRSVRSGRTNDEVRANPDAQWFSDRPAHLAAVDFSRHRDDMAALDALGPSGGNWDFDGVTLKLTNLDKVLFPPRGADGKAKANGGATARSRTKSADADGGFTKRDLIRWYAMIAPVLVPYLEGRAVNLHRFPNGVTTKGFWHKAVPSHTPDWITRWHYEAADPDETQSYFVIDRPATLAWLANYGAVELHPWTSPTAAPDRPTYALIDIDPGADTTWDDTLALARLYRTALQHLGVAGWPKVTGRRGLQIWIPIPGIDDFAASREWVESVSRTIGRVVPDLVSWEWGVKARRGRARLDYTQNAVNKTLVAPYSVRAAPGAPVSMPITWDELDDPDLRPDGWTIADAGARVLEVGDLFAGVLAPHPPPLPEL